MTVRQAQVDLGIDAGVEVPTTEEWIDLPGLSIVNEPKGIVYTRSWVVGSRSHQGRRVQCVEVARTVRPQGRDGHLDSRPHGLQAN